MTDREFFIHLISGHVATLEEWRADYNSMDAELWHGKPAEECNPEDWLEDGLLKEVEADTNKTTKE